MIDIHCHLVYGVDDGAKTLDDTIEMLKEAKTVGFTDIILTPHYSEYFRVPARKIKNKIEKIINESKYLGINLYHGNEIYASSHMIDNIKKNKAVTLNNSKYLLFEFPMNVNALSMDEIISEILNDDKIPVLAHPERYKVVQENPNIVTKFIEKGVLCQANYGSIIGIYGNEAKETVEKLFNKNQIYFLGSDNHRTNTIYKQIPNILIQLEKLIGKEKLDKLTIYNPSKILLDTNDIY